MKIKLFITIAIAITAQGCSIMPYQEESSCKFDGLGKCLPIDKAYKEAITGVDQGGTLVNGAVQNSSIETDDKQPYVDDIELKNQLIYQQTQSLVNPVEMPLLQPAVVQRVFINAHRSEDFNMWHEAKRVYYIETQPHWTLSPVKTHQNNHNTFNLFK